MCPDVIYIVFIRAALIIEKYFKQVSENIRSTVHHFHCRGGYKFLEGGVILYILKCTLIYRQDIFISRRYYMLRSQLIIFKYISKINNFQLITIFFSFLSICFIFN